MIDQDRLEREGVGYRCRRCGISVFAPPERAVQNANYCTACCQLVAREIEQRQADRRKRGAPP
jgi:uncharacterized OB-fold protein